jgi:NhaA family Na+:H+ antiporter
MDRMGILTGSILAALIGYGITAIASRKAVTSAPAP